MHASTPIRSGVVEALWRFASGQMPNYHNGTDGHAGWMKYTHRGIQRLDRLHLGRSTKQSINSKRFEFRVNTAFEEVVCRCADLARQGHTWIAPEVARMYVNLHLRGFAHSYEAWQDGALVGGTFGIHLGGLISLDSMFHTVSNAGTVAYGRAMVLLRDRGFEFVDTNGVSPFSAKFGAEWVPQWQFEVMARQQVALPRGIADDRPATPLPWAVRIMLPASRAWRALCKRARFLPQEVLIGRHPALDQADQPAASNGPMEPPENELQQAAARTRQTRTAAYTAATGKRSA